MAGKVNFMSEKWRPMMAVTYMAIVICDFIIFPVAWTFIQFYETEVVNDAFRQWVPLSLQSGGLIHMAFGAILGISAWGRTQEKMNGSAYTPTPTLDPNPPPYVPSSRNYETSYEREEPSYRREEPSYNRYEDIQSQERVTPRRKKII